MAAKSLHPVLAQLDVDFESLPPGELHFDLADPDTEPVALRGGFNSNVVLVGHQVLKASKENYNPLKANKLTDLRAQADLHTTGQDIIKSADELCVL